MFNKSLSASIVALAMTITSIPSHAKESVDTPDSLTQIITDLKQAYPVGTISTEDFSELSSDDIVVFDVRQPIEYDVSHIQNAIHLDPDASKVEFLSHHAKTVEGKVVVFYCSVGQRSSSMLAELADDLEAIGIKAAYNLEGGAFKWHNEDLPLRKNSGPTRDIHPYSEFYEKYVDDKLAIEYGE